MRALAGFLGLLAAIPAAAEPTVRELYDAATRLREAKVERTMGNCLRQYSGDTNEICTKLMRSLDERAKQAIGTILPGAHDARVNGPQFLKEFRHCHDPQHDYWSSVLCLEAFAVRIEDARNGSQLLKSEGKWQ